MTFYDQVYQLISDIRVSELNGSRRLISLWPFEVVREAQKILDECGLDYVFVTHAQ